MNWKEEEKILVVIILEFSVFQFTRRPRRRMETISVIDNCGSKHHIAGPLVSLCGRSSLEHLIFSRCRSCSASCSWIHVPPFCLSRAARIARHKLGWHLYSAQFMLLCILKRSNCGVSGCDCSPFITIQTRRVHETTSKEFPLHYVRNWFLDFDTQKSRFRTSPPPLKGGVCRRRRRKSGKRANEFVAFLTRFTNLWAIALIWLLYYSQTISRRLAFGNIGDWLGLCAYG